jgi:glycosyltransferase involved in cell wall biosynthesis
VTPITQPAKTSLLGRTPIAPSTAAPRVSVVIPTYNRAPLVVRAIRSVLAQTVSDIEVIVVDDASTDGTRDAVAQIDDPRLQFVRLTKNARQSRAMNEGIARARADWVAFLDDDDEWLPNKLEAQLARLEQVPDASAVYCRCYAQTSEGLRPPRPRTELPEGDITDALLRQALVITPSAYLVRRAALLEVGGFDEALIAAQDLDLWLRVSQAGHRFVIVAEPALVIYHAEDDKPGVSGNAVAQARAFRLLDARWGPLMRERIGVEEYERWRGNRSKKLSKAHEKLVRGIVRSGSRSDALRYVRAMAPVWPWGAAFTMKSLAVAAFGRLPHRISRVRQGKSGAPWLRRLFGAG